MKYYLVYVANPVKQWSDPNGPGHVVPGHPPTVEILTVVEAIDPEDAANQVVQSTQRLGTYLVVECDPVTIQMTPQRLIPSTSEEA